MAANPRPFLAPTSEPRTYVGCCHCQALKLTGIAWVRPSRKEDVQFERRDALSIYQWGEKHFKYEFCSRCGVVMGAWYDKHDLFDLNARILEDVDIRGLKAINDTDALSWPPPYEPPVFKGLPFADAPVEGAKVYYGNCHCKAVVFAAKLPFVETEKTDVNECDCSFCWRTARMHCYPASPADVHITGAEHLTKYKRGTNYGCFCSTCGTHMFMESIKENTAAEAKDGIVVRAITVRVLQGVDVDKLNVDRWSSRDDPPLYEVK